jgi:hypothetical protein
MAAVTETSGTRRELITGRMRIVKASLADVDTTDTWDPGLSIIEHFSFTPTTAGATTQWGATISNPASRQARVTFVLESGTLEGTAVAWGH